MQPCRGTPTFHPRIPPAPFNCLHPPRSVDAGGDFVLDDSAALRRLQEAKDSLRYAVDRGLADYMMYQVNPPVLYRGWALRLDTLEPVTENVPEGHWAACVRRMRLTETQVCWAEECAGGWLVDGLAG